MSPNIIFVVLDDVGFSDLGCYGSEINTPAMDALAAGGLRYSNFHVTAMCSPTRACLLTGRNAHAVGVGIIAEFATGQAGYQGCITPQAATLPELLRDHGWGTYAIGKWHLTNIEHYGAPGPCHDWPLGRGFNHWYGFHGGLANHWDPELYRDNSSIKLTRRPGYHLSEDLVDQAIANVTDHVSSARATPFLLYLAFGACHFPHHVPAEYIDRQRGRYDAGWDSVRKVRLERQKKLGIVPPDTALAPLNPGVQPWHELSADVRTLSARFQEAYAAMLEHTDTQVDRLVQHVKALGQYENTLIVLLSDNGASDEGGLGGSFNQRTHVMYEPEAPAHGLSLIDRIGSEYAWNHYPAGWAQVSNTPLKWYKKDAHGGGIRAPLIVHWPQRIKAAGEVRRQYHHVIDIAPTLYELLEIEAPAQYAGVPQLPIHGTSALYTIDEPDAPTRKLTQHFEILGDRAIWHRGWKAVARHAKGIDFDADAWELYHLEEDFAEANDLAAAHPEKLRELVELWWAEAREHGVLPLDDRGWERFAERMKAREVLNYTFHAGMARVDNLACPNITDRSYAIRAEIDVPSGGAEGVLLAWGTRFGGMTLYLQEGIPCFEYIYSEAVTHLLRGAAAMTPGHHEVSLHFERTAKRGGVAKLLVDGECVAQAAIPKAWPMYGVSAGLTCGADDSGAPVSERYTQPFIFTGTLHKVCVELGDGGGRPEAELAKAVLRQQ